MVLNPLFHSQAPNVLDESITIEGLNWH